MDEEKSSNASISSLDPQIWPEQASCVDIKEYLWQTQSDLTSLPSIMSVFAVIYSLIITLGVLGNSLVILSVMRHKSLQSVRNMFIVSLSCSDIVVSVVSGTITPIMAFTKVWLIGAPLCKLVPVIQGASLCFSTLTLTAIAIDRFILIIYPTKRSIQKRHACRMIVLNCIIAYSISAPMFFKQELVTFDQFCGKFCYEDWSGTLVFVLQFVIPFFVITFCYLMISVKLSKGMMVKREGSNYSTGASTQPTYKLTIQQSEQRRVALKRRLRTNRMLMGMVGVFLCCWTPSVVFNFLRDYEWLPSFIVTQAYLYGVITHCISMSSTVWNPVLYALLNEHFRLAFVELFHRLRHRWLHLNTGEEGSYMTTQQFNNRAHRCSRLVSNAFLLDTTSPPPNHAKTDSKGVINGDGVHCSSSNEPTITASIATTQNGGKGVTLLGTTTSLSLSSNEGMAVRSVTSEPLSSWLLTGNTYDLGMGDEKRVVERQRLEEEEDIGCSENDDEI